MPSSELKKRNKIPINEPDTAELELESLIFGSGLNVESLGKEFVPHQHQEATPVEDEFSELRDDQLFVVDTIPGTADSPAAPPLEITSTSSEGSNAVWHDEDDEQLQIDISEKNILRKLRQDEDENIVSGANYEARLRKQHERLFPKPTWADDAMNQKITTEETEEDDLFRTTGGLLHDKRQSILLSPDLLDVARVRDANFMEPNESIVRSVHWHPSGQVLLTAGFDKTLRLFQIDGKENPKLQSIYFKDMPIYQAAFTHDGDEILAVGRRKFFYSFDVETGSVTKIPGIRGRDEKSFESFSLSPCNQYISFAGKDGDIVLVSRRTKQYIGSVKMNGTVRNIDFSPDGSYMYSSGGDGEIYKWDLRMRKCIYRFADDGAIHTTALSVAGNGGYVATGSDSGIVNLYSEESLQSHSNPRPQPIKALGNLTTSIDHVKFSHDGQMMAMSSHVKKDQLRMVHLPSCRVFANWPTMNTPLGYVQCFDFSPNSGYMAIGNAKGKVLLYRLAHYPSA